jgi:ribonuclease H2 subunit B
MPYVAQADGSLGTFRPIEDLFEAAATHLTRDTTASSKTDPTLAISEQDVMELFRLDCIASAVRSVCEVKGASAIGLQAPRLTVNRVDR